MRRVLDRALLALCVFLLVSPAISVFLWMLSLAFKNEVDNLAYPPVFIPSDPTFNNFLTVFRETPFFRYLGNSLIVSGSATLLALAFGVPAGYAVARLKARKLMRTDVARLAEPNDGGGDCCWLATGCLPPKSLRGESLERAQPHPWIYSCSHYRDSLGSGTDASTGGR